MKQRRHGDLAVVVLACAVGACGKSGSSNTPTPAAPSTPAPVAPAPPPAPAPLLGSTCRFGEGSPIARCSREAASFNTEIERAIDLLVQQQPQIFDLNNDAGNGNYSIRSLGQFAVGMVQNLEAAGLCANFDGEEFQVKDSNNFSDQYDLILASGHIRRGVSAYRATCYPAAFPLPREPPGQAAGCSLPGSRELACSRETAIFRLDVESALDQLIKESPDLFNAGDNQPGTNFIKVLNVDGYVQGMVRIMGSKGYCGRWDGEELAVKKENRMNEQFDILTAANYTRRGEGAYRSTCYPAAF